MLFRSKIIEKCLTDDHTQTEITIAHELAHNLLGYGPSEVGEAKAVEYEQEATFYYISCDEETYSVDMSDIRVGNKSGWGTFEDEPYDKSEKGSIPLYNTVYCEYVTGEELDRLAGISDEPIFHIIDR